MTAHQTHTHPIRGSRPCREVLRSPHWAGARGHSSHGDTAQVRHHRWHTTPVEPDEGSLF